MRLVQTLLLGAAAFIGGIVFVIACGDDGSTPTDARASDANDCSQCEPLTSERIYQVRDENVQPINGTGFMAVAQCQPGDLLMGGGCWLLAAAADDVFDVDIGATGHEVNPIVSGPLPPFGGSPGEENRYFCYYAADNGQDDMQIIATAICLQPSPAE